MASMEDLVATISGGLHAGQQGNDLRDLHAKLTQTIHQQPHYRPIPSSASSNFIPAGTHSSTGPLPPPAPASSWNTPVPPSSGLQGMLSDPNSGNTEYLQQQGTSPMRQNAWIAGKRQTGFNTFPINAGGGNATGSSSMSSYNQLGSGGASIPMPKNAPLNANNANSGGVHIQVQDEDDSYYNGDGSRPYHANVLPMKASPKDTGGFSEDAFKPLWTGNDDNYGSSSISDKENESQGQKRSNGTGAGIGSGWGAFSNKTR